MVKKYKSKPKQIEAIQWTGENLKEVKEFCKIAFIGLEDDLTIPTLEGHVCGAEGCFVIKGLVGEFYICREDIFHRSYEEIVDCSDPVQFCSNCGCGKKERLGG